MAYSFQGISQMSSALRAYQTALDTTGDNIANVNTSGYVRRSATISSASTTPITLGTSITIGNGVNVLAVSRVRDMFLEGRALDATSKLGKSQELSTGLTAIQESMMEPGSEGISAELDKFYNAWSALSASPSDTTAQKDVQSSGIRLASRISTLAVKNQQDQLDNEARITDLFDSIDAKATELAKLNEEIATARAHGGEPNDLYDKQDKALKELSAMVSINVNRGNNGAVAISIGGRRLVDPSGANPVPRTYNAATGQMLDGSAAYTITGGQLAGAFEVQGSLESLESKLDTLSETIRTSTNALVQTGTNSAGATGLFFFVEPVPPATSLTAADLKVDPAIVADASTIPAGTTGYAGDGSLATQLADLRNASQATLGGKSVTDYYSTMVSDIGRSVASADAAKDTNTAVLSQVDAQISSVSGVSLDDEMANMLRFQRAYQAAAKALSTFDQNTETLLNMLNR